MQPWLIWIDIKFWNVTDFWDKLQGARQIVFARKLSVVEFASSMMVIHIRIHLEMRHSIYLPLWLFANLPRFSISIISTISTRSAIIELWLVLWFFRQHILRWSLRFGGVPTSVCQSLALVSIAIGIVPVHQHRSRLGQCAIWMIIRIIKLTLASFT